MTTTSDDDGTASVEPGDAYPVSPAYGSRALGDHDDTETAPIQGLPLVPAPIDPVQVASTDSWDPEQVEAPRARPEPPPAPVTPEAVAPQDPADEHPTVVLAAAGAGASYLSDDVLPAGHVGRTPRGHRVETGSPTADGLGPREARLRPTGPSPLGRVVLPLVLALVSGVAIVAGWAHLQDDRSGSTTSPGSSQSPSSTPSPTSTGSASPSSASAAPSGTPSVSPSAAASTTPVVVASSPAASPTTSASSSTAPTADRSVPVVVLNSTARTGLAAKVAAQLRKDGWTVVLVGNYGGLLAVTTVYAEGHADAVATLQRDLPTRDRLRAPFGAMNPNRLTVVIGADYPRG